MSKLGDALKRKFKTPEAALKALGLDESILKNIMTGDSAMKARHTVTKGDLIAHFVKRQDAQDYARRYGGRLALDADPNEDPQFRMEEYDDPNGGEDDDDFPYSA